MNFILSIDGDVIEGAFPAAFLVYPDERCCRPRGEYFDLIASTSTGSIIAIDLAVELSAKDILQLYKNEDPAIFTQEAIRARGWLNRRCRTDKHPVWGPNSQKMYLSN